MAFIHPLQDVRKILVAIVPLTTRPLMKTGSHVDGEDSLSFRIRDDSPLKEDRPGGLQPSGAEQAS